MKRIASYLACLLLIACVSKTKHMEPKNTSANVDVVELGEWKIGDYLNDFKEPIGKHFVYQVVDGKFSNSATAGSPLRVVIRIDSLQNDGRVPASVLYDEYNNGVFDDNAIHGGKIVCNATRTVYEGSSYPGFYESKYRDGNKPGYLCLIDLLRLEQILDFTDQHGEYTTTIYSYTINCQHLNNALTKAGILNMDK